MFSALQDLDALDEAQEEAKRGKQATAAEGGEQPG